MRFEFTKQYHGTLYVYNSENEVLYTSNSANCYESRQMREKEAVRLLMDIIYGDVKPLSSYFAGYGRDSVGTCGRCGGAL